MFEIEFVFVGLDVYQRFEMKILAAECQIIAVQSFDTFYIETHKCSLLCIVIKIDKIV